MNDRYLFRGKRIDNGEWIQGYYYEEDGTDYIAFYDDCFYDGKQIRQIEAVVSETIGQSTGLRDKNGSLIYEGDVGKCNWGISKVIFEDGCFWACYGKQLEYLYCCQDYEVIGNIHEHKHLLEVE